MPGKDVVEYLFIGGGLANATAAQEVRARDADGRIVIIAAETHLPYHRPPLSKEYLRGEVGWDEALVAKEADWAEKRIEVRTGTRAAALNTTTREVALDTGETLTYEKLCLATGATPKRLSPDDVPGAAAPNVHVLRTRDDSDALRGYLRPGARAVLIGAGYIGMEVAADCRQKGVEVTVVDTAPQPWGRFASPAFGGFLQRYYEKNGVRFLLNDGVKEIVTDARGDATAVRTKSDQHLPADFVLVGIGVSLNLELAKRAGLRLDEKEGVEVSEFLQTSARDVYAAGDIAKFTDPVMGKSWHVEHWQNAEWHGQIAGANMAGELIAYDHVPWFFSDEFDLHMTLRGDSQSAKSSFFVGSPETDKRFLELYLRDDGTLAMGLLISPETDEEATADLLEKLIRARIHLGPYQEELASQKRALESFLPA